MSSARDLEMWKDWDKERNSYDKGKKLSKLLKRMKPILRSATKSWEANISPSIIESEAKIQALAAFKTFDPNRGVKLSTHVTNTLKKVNRLGYEAQEIFSVPESRRIKYKNYENSMTRLEDKFSREATVDEVANDLNWSKAEVMRFNQESWKELSDTQPLHSDFTIQNDRNSSLLSYVYNDLTPKQKSVFEMATGYGGKKPRDSKYIMKKLKLSQGQLSYYKNIIKDRIQTTMGSHGV